MSTAGVRRATLADVPELVKVCAEAFIDDGLFGDFLHPRRREFPNDWLRAWKDRISRDVNRPGYLAYVRTDVSGRPMAYGLFKRLGDEAPNDENAASDQKWIDRSANPDAFAAFAASWEDISHYFSGPRKECWMIDTLCVHPDAQKMGYGRDLVYQAGRICQAEHPPIPLCVIASDVGDAFYEKLGFREVGRANVGRLSCVRGGSVKFYDQHLS